MAIKWNVEIQVIERASRRLRIIASRIETDAQENILTSFGPYSWMANVDPDDMVAVRDAVVAGLWGQYEAEVNGRISEANIVAGYETAISNALLAQEP